MAAEAAGSVVQLAGRLRRMARPLRGSCDELPVWPGEQGGAELCALRQALQVNARQRGQQGTGKEAAGVSLSTRSFWNA